MKEVVNLIVKNNPAASKLPVTFLGTPHEYITMQIINSIEFLLSNSKASTSGTLGFYVISQDEFQCINSITGETDRCISMNIVYDPYSCFNDEYVFYRDKKMWRDLAKE